MIRRRPRRDLRDPKGEMLRQIESARRALAQLSVMIDAHAAIESPTWSHVETVTMVRSRLQEIVVATIS